MYQYVRFYYGLPWWLRGKEPTCQCRRRRFDPWVGKIPWRKKWQPTPVSLPGEFHGQWSLEGYQSVGSQRLSDWIDNMLDNMHIPILCSVFSSVLPGCVTACKAHSCTRSYCGVLSVLPRLVSAFGKLHFNCPTFSLTASHQPLWGSENFHFPSKSQLERHQLWEASHPPFTVWPFFLWGPLDSGPVATCSKFCGCLAVTHLPSHHKSKWLS